MSNKLLGGITIVLGLLIFFAQNENDWIFSAILLGVVRGLFFWDDN